MAVLKSSELLYSTPVRFSNGALWFTVTQVEIPKSKEYESGTLELNLAKLGLTVESIAGTSDITPGGEPTAGEVASTTAPPAAVWCSPVAAEAATQNEAAKKEVKTGYLAQVTPVKGVPVLRLYSLPTAGDGKPLVEAKTATKVEASANLVVTVFALGK